MDEVQAWLDECRAIVLAQPRIKALMADLGIEESQVRFVIHESPIDFTDPAIQEHLGLSNEIMDEMVFREPPEPDDG